jgi:acyl carrier protein
VESDELAERVRAELATVKRLPIDQVPLDATLASLGFDSLETLTLLFEVEERFSVSIPDEEARAVKSVADVVALVRATLARKTT